MSKVVRMMAIPGSVQFTYRAHEIRTEGYRTWYGPQIGWCWECLLCGQWESSQPTRAAAVARAGESHPSWCHVRTGCSCTEPHITARMAGRLGLGDEVPAHLAQVLFGMAGGVRKPCPPCFDWHGTPFCETARQIVAARETQAG